MKLSKTSKSTPGFNFPLLDNNEEVVGKIFLDWPSQFDPEQSPIDTITAMAGRMRRAGLPLPFLIKTTTTTPWGAATRLKASWSVTFSSDTAWCVHAMAVMERKRLVLK